MLPCLARGHAAFRRADEEALTYQIRLAYRFHRFRLLAHHGRQIVQADGASVEIGDDGLKHCYIQTVKTFGIDLIKRQRLLDIIGTHRFEIVHDGPIPNTTKQAVGNSRRAAGTHGQLASGPVLQLD